VRAKILPTHSTIAPTQCEERVALKVDDLRLKERVTTHISRGKSTNFYRLLSCGSYAVIDETAFILPIKD